MKRHWIIWLFISNSAIADNLLTLHIHKSPTGYNWTSPASFALDSIKNNLETWIGKHKHAMGHISLRLDCPENKIDQYIAITKDSILEEYQLLLFQGAGLGNLLHNFQGRLESKEEIQSDLDYNSNNGNVLLLSFKINSKACKNTKKYFELYSENEFWRNYGLPNQPLKGQGANSAAFAISTLQVAGIDYTNFDRFWSDHVFIPKALVGPHNSDIYLKNEQELKKITNETSKVPFWTIFDNKHKWIQNNDSIVIKYYSPDKIYDWANSIAENPETSPEQNLQLRKYKKTFQLIYDYTNRYQHFEIERITHDKKNI